MADILSFTQSRPDSADEVQCRPIPHAKYHCFFCDEQARFEAYLKSIVLPCCASVLHQKAAKDQVYEIYWSKFSSDIKLA